jgi:CheY-like chemotaxis protein
MPGYERLQLLSEIKQRRLDLLVMMVTAYSDDEPRQRATALGVRAVPHQAGGLRRLKGAAAPTDGDPANGRNRRSAEVQLEAARLLVWGDTVEEVWFEVIAAVRIGGATTPVSAASPQVAAIGAGTGISMASLRRFWVVAARWNSSRAPFGPRNRNRSSFRMRLRWANNISTFFRSRLEAT